MRRRPPGGRRLTSGPGGCARVLLGWSTVHFLLPDGPGADRPQEVHDRVRTYETMLLLDPRKQDAEIEVTVERFSSLVTERGGSITNVEKWGRRRLAYEIDDLTEGYYTVVTYDLESDKRTEIEEALPFLEGLLRAKTVRPEPRTRST